MKLSPYLFVLPAGLLFTFFILVPIGQTVYYSFFESIGTGPKTFVGFSNYIRALTQDSIFLDSSKHNLIYLALTLVLEVAVGLGLAVLLNKKGKLFGVLRAMFFAPLMLSMVVVGLLWSFVYDPTYGLLNGTLKALGLGSFAKAWLGGTATALYAICVVSGWVYAGFYLVLFYAGLQRIPPSLIESARLDGANARQCFWHITLPLLREVLVVSVLLCATGAFKMFDLVYVMTDGGPYHSTEVVSTWLVKQAFDRSNMGYGAALAVLMSTAVLGVALAYLSYMKRKPKLEY